jgi:hypothetical protein
MSVLTNLLGTMYGGQSPQPMGVLGAAMQAQPQAMAQPMQTQARPKFWQSPEFASTLSRLGANLAAASTQNEGFLDSLSLASAQTQKDMEAARAQAAQNELLQAQIAKTRAESQPASPFSGTGFENQVAGTYYNAYLQQGLSPLEAQIKAAQAVFNREPSYVTDAAGNLVPIPGRTLPSLGATEPMAAPTARQPDAIDQATSALGFAPQTSGMVLPPPSGVGAPDATLFQGAQAPQVGQAPRITAPQGAGPRTQQALDEAAGKGQIELNIEAAKKLQEKQALLPKAQAGFTSAISDIDRTIEAIDNVLPNVAGQTAGLRGAVLGVIPGTSAYDLEAALKQIKASNAFGALQDMRNNSPTGGALGGIAVPELQLLESTKGSVDRGQSPQALAKNLQKMRDEYSKMRERVTNAFNQDFSQLLQQPIQAPPPPTSPQRGVPQGVDQSLWNLMTPEERALWQQ